MEPSRRRITDPGALKALAHPVRVALLGALVTEGPMTASQVADLVGESPSNCSWHLRKLAEHGFVEEAPGGTGRNRPWRAAADGLEWGDDEEDPATRVAAEALTDLFLEGELRRLRAARAARDQEPRQWRDATGVAQAQLWLTAEETAGLRDRMSEIFSTHVERQHDPASRPDGARLVTLVGWLVPSGSHKPDRPGQEHETSRHGRNEGENS